MAAHAVATRRKMQAGEIVTIDVAGVHKRYHINCARTFFLGEAPADVRDVANRAAGVMNVVADCLRPGLPVRELNERVKQYYEEQDLWSRRGWIGGYEMGIGFLSDWVGNFVYDPLAEKNTDRSFEPGTAVQSRDPDLPAPPCRPVFHDRMPAFRSGVRNSCYTRCALHFDRSRITASPLALARNRGELT